MVSQFSEIMIGYATLYLLYKDTGYSVDSNLFVHGCVITLRRIDNELGGIILGGLRNRCGKDDRLHLRCGLGLVWARSGERDVVLIENEGFNR